MSNAEPIFGAWENNLTRSSTKHHEITTLSELRSYMRVAKEICVQVRFGTCEQWVKISKASASELFKGLPNTITPTQAEMYTGTFGSFDGSTLYLG